MDGVTIGLNNLHYALLTSDEVGTITYSAPVAIPGVITADINPNASNETLFADDGPMETASTLGQITLDLTVADLPLEVQGVLLGHAIVGGVLLRKSSDVPPWVAIGFQSLKSNGKYRFVWLVKGKFAAPEQKGATKSDKLAFQTPSIKGNFVKRDGDDLWQKTTDEDAADYVASMGTAWFSAVEGTADTTPPTIATTVPVNAAVGVAVTSNMVWNFDEAILPSSVNSDNFFVFKDADNSAVAGALTVNAAYTQVTFDPTVNLSAASKYWAAASSSIQDRAGNHLATAKLVSFTTA